MSEKLVYQGSFISVVRETVTLPNGHSTDLDLIHHPGASAIVPFVSKDEILLLKQYRHAVKGILYEVPAGKLEGEPPEVCAYRELEEETGYRAKRMVELTSIWTTPGFTDEKIHLFAAFDLEETQQNLDEDELIEVIRMPFKEALKLVWNSEISDAKSALALLHAEQYLDGLP